MATTNEQLAAAVKAAAEANAKVEELKKQSRDADLETVKELCKTHGFTATQLRGFLKVKGKGKAADGMVKKPRKAKAATI